MEEGETDTSCIITTSLSYIATRTCISRVDTCVSEKYMLHYCMVYCVV